MKGSSSHKNDFLGIQLSLDSYAVEVYAVVCAGLTKI